MGKKIATIFFGREQPSEFRLLLDSLEFPLHDRTFLDTDYLSNSFKIREGCWHDLYGEDTSQSRFPGLYIENGRKYYCISKLMSRLLKAIFCLKSNWH